LSRTLAQKVSVWSISSVPASGRSVSLHATPLSWQFRRDAAYAVAP
jgi:hypothetical protein